VGSLGSEIGIMPVEETSNWLLVSLLCGSQDASDIREPAKQDGSLRKMAAIGLSKRII
jgi:hypothetical protein